MVAHFLRSTAARFGAPFSSRALPSSIPLVLSDPSDVRAIGLHGLNRRDPARLAIVHATGLLDSEVEEVFDRLTRLAVRLLRVPAAFISLVDANRDFYKSACGFGEPLASARELAGPTFCHYTVQQSTPLVIPDTAADPIYRDVATVQTLHVAAYVGVPLIVDGQAIGALCTIDTKPHAWTPDEVEILVELAASVQREIELRGATARANATAKALQDQRSLLERSNHELQQQAMELDLQADALQATSAHLEERTEEAETANRAKGEFLSMMSHELRTPLNAISGYAELLGMGVRGPIVPAQQEFLDRIRRASRHLELLIGEILEFARLDAGQLRYDVKDLVVAEIIEEAVELIAPQLNERGIVFNQENRLSPAAEARPTLRGDSNRVRQILVNLLTNASNFTPSGGRVSVIWARRGSRVEIEVSDSGRGIAPDQLTNIFQPFIQLRRDETPGAHQGVGLGLAISRELARGMSGDLTVRSVIGTGSIFTLGLPAAEPALR